MVNKYKMKNDKQIIIETKNYWYKSKIKFKFWLIMQEND